MLTATIFSGLTSSDRCHQLRQALTRTCDAWGSWQGYAFCGLQACRENRNASWTSGWCGMKLNRKVWALIMMWNGLVLYGQQRNIAV